MWGSSVIIQQTFQSNFPRALGLLLAAVFVGHLQADPPPKAVLELTDDLPMTIENGIAIPVPNEVFSSLDKLGKRNWRNHIEPLKVDIPTDRREIALLFGLVIADGFVAVQAEAADQVQEVGREVMRLSEALGVKHAVVAHAQSIIESAVESDWERVRAELDRTQSTVVQTMEEMHDQVVAELVSIGGWLGGTRALAATLNEKYDVQGSELLHQADLIKQLGVRAGEIADEGRDSQVLDQVHVGFTELAAILERSHGGVVTEKDVAEILTLSKNLSKAIQHQS